MHAVSSAASGMGQIMGGIYWFYVPGMCTCPQWARPQPLVLKPNTPWNHAPVPDFSQMCDFCKHRGALFYPPEKRPDVCEREQMVNADARAMLHAGTPEPESKNVLTDEHEGRE